MADFDPMQPVGGSPLPPDNQHWRMMLAQAEDDLAKARDAIESLTAENARLQFELRTERRASQEMARQCLSHDTQAHAAYEAQKRAEAEVERLTEQLAAKQSALDIVWTENGHLNRIEQAAAEYVETAVALTRPHTDMDRTRAAFRNQPGAIGRLIAAVQAYRDRDWYATHRAKVEADHAAAKKALTSRQYGDDMGDWLDWKPSCAAAKDDGIDMALLGRLCREEPDEAAKREVAEMMGKLNGGS